MLNLNNRLHAALAAACPIVGVSIGTPGDSSTVRIDFAPGATADQQAAAQSALASFDWSDAAQSAWDATQAPERTTLLSAATQAVSDIDAYLAIATPTNAQVAAQVRRLSQYMRAVIKRLIQIN